MNQIFVELYNYKPAWKELPEAERTDFVNKVIASVTGLQSLGVEVIGYGVNSTETDRRAPYDFFCVYRVPSVEFQREFERQVAASGWYGLFDQVNVSGELRDFGLVLLANAKLDGPT